GLSLCVRVSGRCRLRCPALRDAISLVCMGDPGVVAQAVERWLDQLDPNDRAAGVHNVSPLTAAASRLHHAVADALDRGVPPHVIRVFTEHLGDRISVLLRNAETIPASELTEQLGIRDEVDDA